MTRHARAARCCALGLIVLTAPGVPSDAAGVAPPTAPHERVEAACSQLYIHGIDDELTRRVIRPEDVVELHRLLRDPMFDRRDNVVAFLIYAGDSSTTLEIRRFLEVPPAPVTTSEEDRAFLMVPDALAAMAGKDSLEALQVLLEITEPGGEGGPLRHGVDSGAYGSGLRQDLIERAIRALGRVDDDSARSRLEELAAGRRILGRVRRVEARHALEGEIRSDSNASVVPAASENESVGPESLDDNLRIHEAKLNFTQHVAIPIESRMTSPRADDLLRRATELAGRADSSTDVACCITVRRDALGSLFTDAGLDIIDNENELNAVLQNGNARIKIVREINWCGEPASNILGCSLTPGDSITVVRSSSLLNEAKLWLHEYGHNTGLLHTGSNSAYLMFPFLISGGNDELTDLECDTFHSPSALANMTLVDIGVCEDVDGDQVVSGADNCPTIPNFSQLNSDGDNRGNACDNCPNVANYNQANGDGDAWGDVCDNCVTTGQLDQDDADADGAGDVCDACPLDAANDADQDGFCADVDNCPDDTNPNQIDVDQDGSGDPCDLCPNDAMNDADQDGFCADVDNCPDDTNPSQADGDGDGIGDACDACPVGEIDPDNDGLTCSFDACPADPLNDVDGDGLCADDDLCPNDAMNDADQDGFCADVDNCPDDTNPSQADGDGDGIGDACDACPVGEIDPDNDGLTCSFDACPADPRNDVDGDGFCAADDLCPDLFNPLDNGPQFLGPGDTLEISSDRQWAVITENTGSPGAWEAGVYVLSVIDGAPNPVHAGPQDPDPLYYDADSGPDAERVIYRAHDVDPGYQLHSVAIDGTDPRQLSGSPPVFGTVHEFNISAAAARVVYLAGDAAAELYSVPILGGNSVRLHAGLQGEVVEYALTPDGDRVLFRAQSVDPNNPDLLSAAVDGSDSFSVHPASVIGGSGYGVKSFVVAPSGDTVVYRYRTPTHSEVWSASISGGAPSHYLGSTDSDDYLVSPDSTTLVLSAGNLYIGPIDGSTSWSLLAPGHPALIVFTPDGQALVGRFPFIPGSPVKYIPLDGGTQVQLTAPDTVAFGDYTMHPTESILVYRAQEAADSHLELYWRALPDGPPIRLSDGHAPVDSFAFNATGDWVVFEYYEGTELVGIPFPDGNPVTLWSTAGTGELINSIQPTDIPNSVILETLAGTSRYHRVSLVLDTEQDGVADRCDNCIATSNPDQIDADTDGFGDACDCAPNDEHAFPGSVEINDGQDNDCPGLPGYGAIDEIETVDGDESTGLSWSAQAGAGHYDIARSSSPDFVPCATFSSPGSNWLDPEDPSPGEVFYYLVRPGQPFIGSWGSDSSGSERLLNCLSLGGIFDVAMIKTSPTDAILSWPARDGATEYEVRVASSPGFDGPCTSGSTANLQWPAQGSPVPGEIFFYLVRVLTPTPGSWGPAPGGGERASTCVP